MQSFVLATVALSAVANGLVVRQDSTNVCGSTSTTRYTVASGDTLTSIANKYSSGICDIAKLNNIANVNSVDAGTVLTIPTNCVTPDNSSCNVPNPPPATETCVPGVGSSYDVRSGDTLSAIAASFNITLDAVVAANRQIQDINQIVPGQIINIPICPQSICESVGTRAIQSGDTFFDLAQKYGTTAGQILALNYAVVPTQLAVGQVVIIPTKCHNGTLA